MAIEVVAENFVRALVCRPQLAVTGHDETVDVHRRPRTEIPLAQILAVLVEHLYMAVVAVVDEDLAAGRIHSDSMHVEPVPWALLAAAAPLFTPLEQLLAVHVVLDNAEVVVPVRQVHRVRVHEDEERRPPEVTVVVAGYHGRAELQQELLAVVAELVDGVPLGVHHPYCLLWVVWVDLDVVRAREELVPLPPVFGDASLRVDDGDDMFVTAVDPRPGVALVLLPRVLAARRPRLPDRQPEHREHEAGTNLRDALRLRPFGERDNLSFLHEEHAVRTLREDVHRLAPTEILVVRQARRHRLRPVRHRFVRTEDVLATLQTGHSRESRAGGLLCLDALHLRAEREASREQRTGTRNREHPFHHHGLRKVRRVRGLDTLPFCSCQVMQRRIEPRRWR